MKLPDTPVPILAKWADLVTLLRLEENNVVRRTGLTYEAVYPSNIQKQNMSLTLKVFHENVVAALRCDGKWETAAFIDCFIHFWKVVNCKHPKLYHRLNDPYRRPISSVEDDNLKFLLELAESISEMRKRKGIKGRARMHTLTSETSAALFQTLRGLVRLCEVRYISEFTKYGPILKCVFIFRFFSRSVRSPMSSLEKYSRTVWRGSLAPFVK